MAEQHSNDPTDTTTSDTVENEVWVGKGNYLHEVCIVGWQVASLVMEWHGIKLFDWAAALWASCGASGGGAVSAVQLGLIAGMRMRGLNRR
jgi:hypothetical protein